jgi:hypothetical protein
MDFSSFPAPYLTWLSGQSVAVIVLILWNWTLHRRELRRESLTSTAMLALQKRNDELSNSLVEMLLESSRERAERRESMMRTALEVIEKRLGESSKNS